jgi:hypothetical protein
VVAVSRPPRIHSALQVSQAVRVLQPRAAAVVKQAAPGLQLLAA